MHLVSLGLVQVHGTVDVSGRGPLMGRGSGVSGSGGSYGGSGGMLTDTCGGGSELDLPEYYSVYTGQIGSLDVAVEVSEDPVSGGMGSGGGEPGGGSGGGVIVLQGSSVDVTTGQLLSLGSSSLTPAIGSGSGGGILIHASHSLLSSGAVVSVEGGGADVSLNIAGGSGGRVTVHAPHVDSSVVWGLGGGTDTTLGEDMSSCLVGAAGTLLWTAPSLGKSALYSRNNGRQTLAATLLTETTLLNALTSMTVSQAAVMAVGDIESLNNVVTLTEKGVLVGSYSVERGGMNLNTNETDSKCIVDI